MQLKMSCFIIRSCISMYYGIVNMGFAICINVMNVLQRFRVKDFVFITFVGFTLCCNIQHAMNTH